MVDHIAPSSKQNTIMGMNTTKGRTQCAHQSLDGNPTTPDRTSSGQTVIPVFLLPSCHAKGHDKQRKMQELMSSLMVACNRKCIVRLALIELPCERSPTRTGRGREKRKKERGISWENELIGKPGIPCMAVFLNGCALTRKPAFFIFWWRLGRGDSPSLLSREARISRTGGVGPEW